MKTIKVKEYSEIPDNFTGIVEYEDGYKEWLVEGKLHRLDGPAVEYLDGTKVWYKEGKYHREDGPAVECINGTKEWYKEGIRHRVDGPAVEYSNGYKEWWVDDFLYMAIRLRDSCVDFFFNLEDCIFIESWVGDYGLKWMKFLTEDEVIELPLISEMRFSQQQLDFFIKNKVLDGSEVNGFVYVPKT